MIRRLPLHRFTLLVLMTLLSGCTAMKTVVAHFQSTDHFLALPDDPRIVFEPGAEALARRLQPDLNNAIAIVEAAHYRPFKKNLVVHVCNSRASFARFTGQRDNIRGGVHPTQGLFLNPILLDRPASIPSLLVHELSHLHLSQQHANNFVDYPTWFNEGLATFVSKGGGAEFATEAEAQKLIVAGHIFPPYENGSRLSLDQSGPLGRVGHSANSPMFYRQGMMFIAFLKQQNEKSFRQWLLATQQGELFSDAFYQAFGGDVKTLQEKFIASLE